MCPHLLQYCQSALLGRAPGAGFFTFATQGVSLFLKSSLTSRFYHFISWKSETFWRYGSDHMRKCTAPDMSSSLTDYSASIERLVITMATRRTCISRCSSDVMQLSVSPSRGAIVPAAAAPQVVTAKKSVHFKATPPSSTWEMRSISLQPPG